MTLIVDDTLKFPNGFCLPIRDHSVNLLDVLSSIEYLPDASVNSVEWDMEIQATLNSLGIRKYIGTCKNLYEENSYSMQYEVEGRLINFVYHCYCTATLVLRCSNKALVVVLKGFVADSESYNIDARFLANIKATVYKRHITGNFNAEKLGTFTLKPTTGFNVTRAIDGLNSSRGKLVSFKMNLPTTLSLSGTWINIVDNEGNEDNYSAYFDVVSRTLE